MLEPSPELLQSAGGQITSGLMRIHQSLKKYLTNEVFLDRIMIMFDSYKLKHYIEGFKPYMYHFCYSFSIVTDCTYKAMQNSIVISDFKNIERLIDKNNGMKDNSVYIAVLAQSVNPFKS